jgi:hypothetical protein
MPRKWCIALALLLLGSSGAARADEVPGTAILARTGTDALIIWDATPAIAAIVAGNVSDDAGMRRLESDAVTIASAHAKDLTAAKTISVRITYAKTGAVSPVYGSATFAGVERVATISIPRTLVIGDIKRTESSISDGKIPAGITIVVSGKLPPH